MASRFEPRVPPIRQGVSVRNLVSVTTRHGTIPKAGSGLCPRSSPNQSFAPWIAAHNEYEVEWFDDCRNLVREPRQTIAEAARASAARLRRHRSQVNIAGPSILYPNWCTFALGRIPALTICRIPLEPALPSRGKKPPPQCQSALDVSPRAAVRIGSAVSYDGIPHFARCTFKVQVRGVSLFLLGQCRIRQSSRRTRVRAPHEPGARR